MKVRKLLWDISIPIAVFFVLASLAWAGWRQDTRSAESAVLQNNRMLAAVVSDRLSDYLIERSNDLQSMRQARLAGVLSNDAEFHQRAEGLRTNHPEFSTISWVDSTGRVVWSSGPNGRNRFSGTDLNGLARRSELLLKASHSEEPTLSPVIKMLDGSTGIGILVGVRRASKLDGFVIGGMNGASLILNSVPASYRGEYNVELRENGNGLRVGNNAQSDLSGSVAKNVMGREFTVKVWPTSQHQHSQAKSAALAGFAGFMTLAMIVSAMFYATIQQRRRAIQTAEARQEAADALRVSENRLKDIVAKSPWVIIEHKVGGEILDVNPAAEALYGLKKEQMIGHKPAEWIHPDDLDRTVRQIELEGSGQAVPVLENRNVDSQGKVHHMRWTGAQQFDAKGNPAGVISFGLDITAEAEAAAARDRLLAEEQRLVVRLWVLNDLARNLRASFDRDSLFQMTVRMIPRILQERICAILMLCDGARELEVVAAANIPGHIQSGPIFACGTRFPMDDTAISLERDLSIQRPVHDLSEAQTPRERALSSAGIKSRAMVPLIVDGAVAGFIALYSTSDSTSAAQPHELEFVRGVAEHLSLALTNSRLYNDLKVAYNALHEAQNKIIQMEKLRAVGEMASGIAHDFNNSLAAVLGYAELLSAEPLRGDAKRYVAHIQKAAGDASSTVRRIQGYSRKHSEVDVFSRIEVNPLIDEVVSLTVHKWRDQAHGRGATVEIETELDPSSPVIRGDAAELREVLTNLIFNAVDSIVSTGVIRLTTKVVESRVIISISDTGSGMSEETLGRAFDPFFTTKGLDGSGLGLSVSYGIISRHGGDIRVSSEEGKGSKFDVELPLAQMESASPVTFQDRPESRCKSALVIDDDPAVLDVVSAMLRKLEIQADVAASGPDGIDMLKRQHYDTVFTDLGMPGMTGRDVAVAVKNISPTSFVVLLTGWGEKLRTAGEMPVGVDLVLSKPIRLEDLSEALAAV